MHATAEHSRPLAGVRAWIVTTGAAGMDTQTRGVAEALGLTYEMKPISPRGLYKLLAPWGPVSPGECIGAPGSTFAPPWPDVAIGLGRSAVPYLRAIRRRSPETFTLQMLDTRAGRGTADAIWVPQHDRLRGENVIVTLTAPHSFTPERLTALRSAMPAEIAALPGPRVAVILGGKNAAYRYRDEDYARFSAALKSLGALGASFMVTPSRRTQPELTAVADEATRPFPRLFFNGDGPNPYANFLAHADALVVTADSVNMTGEAAATGRPVLVFTPSAGSAKFHRFHAALENYGATRPLPEHLAAFPDWTYEPLFSAETIAREIERRWLARQGAQT
jgi:mitochondrial fission protein ELM1